MSLFPHSLALTRVLVSGHSVDVMTVGRSLATLFMFQTFLTAKPHHRPHVRLRPGEAGGAQRLQEGPAGQRQHPGGRHHRGESDRRRDVTCIVPASPQPRGKVHLACIHHQHVNILCYSRAWPGQPSSHHQSAVGVIHCISGQEDFSVSEYFNCSGQTWSFRAAGLLPSQLLQDILNKTREFCMTPPSFYYSLIKH